MTKYLIDTNVFIDATDKYECIIFLLWVQSTDGADSICAVYDEISRRHNRELYRWKQQNRNLFLAPSKPVISKMKEVLDWARISGYDDDAVNTFSSGADYILVAHAHVLKCTVVTHETKNDIFNAKRVKIPNACEALGVRWMTAIEMLRAEQAKFLNNPECRAT